MVKHILLSFCCLLAAVAGRGQASNIPAPPQNGAILLLGATAHLGNGQVINNAAIGFNGGKITLVADGNTSRIDRSQYKQVIDVSGKHVYPGFILASTNVGLIEVGSLDDTNDSAEDSGPYNPSVRALVAYNTDSEVIPTMRFNGILTVQATPQGGVVSGQSTVVQLDAWNWEDAAYRADDAMHLNWPARVTSPRWWMGETEARPNPNYDKTIQDIEQWLTDAVAYGKLEKREHINLGLAATQGLFDGSKALFIHTDDAKAIVQSVKLGQQYGVKRMVIVGGGEALLVKDFLVENKIPVILDQIHELPNRDHEDTVLPYKMAKAFYDAGIDFCIGIRTETNRARNLPFTVGTAVAYGLPYEEGIKSITGNAARILGVGDQCGTLEVGKDATLFVSAGDALDMRGNIVEHIFIQGRQVQLSGRQQQLYEKYSTKYGQMKE